MRAVIVVARHLLAATSTRWHQARSSDSAPADRRTSTMPCGCQCAPVVVQNPKCSSNLDCGGGGDETAGGCRIASAHNHATTLQFLNLLRCLADSARAASHV
eukprot:CAMPEP_0115852168 /NCGR_PEP_ID=MMETSP0287-20121206/12856_1 /TAXON_ID=412157 /ORGANISM="Chrysochromulina rotalis, Strain UIO044" /LENGTH=101 /DNA_ID=CAMNT_0003306219 /DNA_START=174 /DNA_END=479 /DNA_ORIENTATION=-